MLLCNTLVYQNRCTSSEFAIVIPMTESAQTAGFLNFKFSKPVDGVYQFKAERLNFEFLHIPHSSVPMSSSCCSQHRRPNPDFGYDSLRSDNIRSFFSRYLRQWYSESLGQQWGRSLLWSWFTGIVHFILVCHDWFRISCARSKWRSFGCTRWSSSCSHSLVGAAHYSHTTYLILSQWIGRSQPHAPQIRTMYSLGLTICCTVSRKIQALIICSKYR